MIDLKTIVSLGIVDLVKFAYHTWRPPAPAEVIIDLPAPPIAPRQPWWWRVAQTTGLLIGARIVEQPVGFVRGTWGRVRNVFRREQQQDGIGAMGPGNGFPPVHVDEEPVNQYANVNILTWLFNGFEEDKATFAFKVLGIGLASFWGVKYTRAVVKYFENREKQRVEELKSIKEDLLGVILQKDEEIKLLLKPAAEVIVPLTSSEIAYSLGSSLMNFIDFLNPFLVFITSTGVIVAGAWYYWKKDNWEIKKSRYLDVNGNEVLRVNESDIINHFSNLKKQNQAMNPKMDITMDIDESQRRYLAYLESLKALKLVSGEIDESPKKEDKETKENK